MDVCDVLSILYINKGTKTHLLCNICVCNALLGIVDVNCGFKITLEGSGVEDSLMYNSGIQLFLHVHFV